LGVMYGWAVIQPELKTQHKWLGECIGIMYALNCGGLPRGSMELVSHLEWTPLAQLNESIRPPASKCENDHCSSARKR